MPADVSSQLSAGNDRSFQFVLFAKLLGSLSLISSAIANCLLIGCPWEHISALLLGSPDSEAVAHSDAKPYCTKTFKTRSKVATVPPSVMPDVNLEAYEKAYCIRPRSIERYFIKYPTRITELGHLSIVVKTEALWWFHCQRREPRVL